ncbi:MAG: hypothetical protein ACR2K5_11440 [Pseudolabrys sp.]
MLKTTAAILFAALAAGAIVGFPDFVSPVSATSSVGVPAIAAPTCPNRGWPYQDCGNGQVVRLVTTDRLH